MMHLMDLLRKSDLEVHFASTAHPTEFSEPLQDLYYHTHLIQLNDKSFDVFVKELQPVLVLFDRFTSEEQFGWRVTEQCPEALQILDTEDLHGLRQARQTAVKENRSLDFRDYHSDLCKREIAAIYRCDLSLIISKHEMDLLQTVFQVSADLLYYLPLPAGPVTETPAFTVRKDFVTIGNFLHAPNRDALLWLKKEIWPLIRKNMPAAQVHNYGAYADEHILQMHDPKNGFHVDGRAASAEEVMRSARVCLAPLRFGAGQKGKLLMAMTCGTPSVTTSTGTEGMSSTREWPGCICNDAGDFANNAMLLYNDETEWQNKQAAGFEIIRRDFDTLTQEKDLAATFTVLRNNLSAHRLKNFTGAMLRQQGLQATKYMALWIEMKNEKLKIKN